MRSKNRGATLRMLFVAGMVGAVLAWPTFAVAEDPVTWPQTLRSEGFESALAADWTISPLVGVLHSSTAKWGRSPRIARSGAWGLWCAGSLSAASPLRSLYPGGSHSRAVLSMPQLANYYSADLSFSYNMASGGDADANAFGVGWMTTGPANDAHGGLPLTAGWTSLSYDLTDPANSFDLSRQAGKVFFQWYDQSEGPLQFVTTGTGPTVDDVKVTGWMYGPVRDLAVTETPGGPRLSWTRPAASTASSAPDDRTPVYRIWRRAVGSTAWVEMVPGGVTSTDIDVGWTDTAVSPGVSCDYAVQPWQGASGPGYGRHMNVRRAAISTDLPAAHATVLKTTGPSSYLAYGTKATLAGTLKDANGTALVGRAVVVTYSYDGTTFKTLRTLTTSADGAFSMTDVRTVRTWYRFSFAGAKGATPEGGDLQASSATRYVWWRPYISAPSPGGRTTITRGATYTWSGVLKPWHSTTATSVYLCRWRWNGTTWVRYSNIRMTNSTRTSGGSTYTVYAARFALPSAGRWRVKAYAPADAAHPATYSALRYVTVR